MEDFFEVFKGSQPDHIVLDMKRGSICKLVETANGLLIADIHVNAGSAQHSGNRIGE